MLGIFIYICVFLYRHDIKCITVHGLMSAGVSLVAHSTEEGLIPKTFRTLALFSDL